MRVPKASIFFFFCWGGGGGGVWLGLEFGVEGLKLWDLGFRNREARGYLRSPSTRDVEGDLSSQEKVAPTGFSGARRGT